MTLVAPPSLLAKTKLFRGLSEPSRLLIVEALRDGPRTVSAICEATGLTQPNTSNHLACLRGCGLVDRRQEGRFAFYRLADDRIEALLALGDDIRLGVTGGGECCPVCGSEE